jgi:nicotinamidase-related amidase
MRVYVTCSVGEKAGEKKERKIMLSTNNTILLVVDIQGKLAHSMHNKAELFENTVKAIKGAQVLKIPILLTEQNPQGLGPTIPEVAGILADLKPIGKFSFSCYDDERFMQELRALNPRNILIAGIEAHICVYQTARDLVKATYHVEIIADAVSSRKNENKEIGLEKCKDAGAALTSVETVLFELLKDARKDKFKAILNIVK